MAPDTLWYFAYGANINEGIFRGRRGMHPTFAEPAILKGYKLVFDHPGIPYFEPSFANVKPEEAAEVHGVLYLMTKDEMHALSKMEGGNAYQDLELEVVGQQAGPQRAHVFWSENTGIRHLRPSKRYVETIIAGAVQHDLHPKWIEELRAIRTSRNHPIFSWLMPHVMRALNELFRRGMKTPFKGWKARQHRKAIRYTMP